ncbi:MAG: COR domain-containing protein [Crocosphaera sp.]
MSDRGYLEALRLIEKAVQEQAETLDLSFKRLTHLPPEITKLESSLKFLDLRNNKLKTLPIEIGELRCLTALNCIDNCLENLPEEIGNLDHLQRLHLAYNQIEALPPEFGRMTQLTELYLSHNNLSFLPVEFGHLHQLERLSLSNNYLQQLPKEFGKLVNLTWLDINSNHLQELPMEIGRLSQLSDFNISNNRLEILPPSIGKLSQLIDLNLSENKLSDLPEEIGNLTNLDSLNIAKNRLKTLPKQIGNLSNLLNVNAIFNELKSLPREIGNLIQLVDLRLTHNNLTQLPQEIVNLNKLQTLYLTNNQFKELSPEIIQLVRYKNLICLDIQNNPISLPSYIIWRKNEPQKIVDFYEYQINRQQRTLNEAKILLVGQGSVGKTSLIRRLIYDEFDQQQEKTDGIDIQPWYPQFEVNSFNSCLENKDIKLNIWDFGGQEIFRATHQFFLTQRSLYLLVLDSRLDERDNQLGYWLQIIKSYAKNSPVIIVINKIDEHFLSLDHRGLENAYPNIKGFIATSCKEPPKGPKGIKELKEIIAQEVTKLSHINDQFPENWLTIKTELEQIKENDWDYISYEDYQNICQQQGISDLKEQRDLIRFLHDLGVVLNFQDDPRLKDTNILNPLWVTKGVYKILDDKALENHYKGILYPHMLSRILDDLKYPPSKHLFILGMMCKFELCFEMEKEGEKQFLIADLLPKEEPENISQWQTGLGIEYHYSVLPGSIISRFIVRMNPLIYQETYWRNGVVLQEEDNMALIKADRYVNKIFIWISGSLENRRHLLEKIRLEFETIHQNIPGIEVNEKIVIPNHPNVSVDYQHLLDLESMGIITFVPVGLRKKMDVQELLQGVHSVTEMKVNSQHQVPPIASHPLKSLISPPRIIYTLMALTLLIVIVNLKEIALLSVILTVLFVGLISYIGLGIFKDYQKNRQHPSSSDNEPES